jgi:hypothetical protein
MSLSLKLGVLLLEAPVPVGVRYTETPCLHILDTALDQVSGHLVQWAKEGQKVLDSLIREFGLALKVFGDLRDYHLDYPLPRAGLRLNQWQATHGLYVLIKDIIEVPHLFYVSWDLAAHLTYLCNAFETCVRV